MSYESYGPTVYLDVRSYDEYKRHHIPNSYNIPMEEISYRYRECGDKTALIIVFCSSGLRSAYSARFLKQNGYHNVIDAGGMIDEKPVLND